MTPTEPTARSTSALSRQERIGSAVGHWVGGVSRHPVSVLALVLLFALISGYGAATRLRVHADQDAMFSDALPHRVVEIAYTRDFPALYENIVVVLDGDDEAAVREATLALARRMRDEPEHFRNIYLPRGDFFERHALLYLETRQVEDFADRLARVQPYLAGLAEDGTLRGLARLLARGARAAYEGDVDADELVPIFRGVTRAASAGLSGETTRFSWAEVVAGPDLAPGFTARGTAGNRRARRFVIAQPVLDFSQLAVAGRSLDALQLLGKELDFGTPGGVRMRVTGDVALSYEEMTLVEQQAAKAGVASFLMVTALLAAALRSLRLVFAIVASLLAGLIVTAGFAAFAVGSLNLISVAFAVLFIGLAADFSLHFVLRYQELLGRGLGRTEALDETSRGVGASLILCAGTTAIGFFAFVPTDFEGVAELGLIAGVGMGIGLAATLTVVPAVLSLGEEIVAPNRRAEVSSLPTWPLRYPLAVAAVAGALALGAAALLPEVHFDPNPLRVRDPSAESVQTYEELLADGATSPWGMAVVAPDLPAAEKLAAALRELAVVHDAETVADFIPSDQEEKLAILEDAALFLAPASKGRALPPTFDEQLAALVELEGELERLAGRAGDRDALRIAAAELRSVLSDFRAAASEQSVASLQESLVGSLPGQLEVLDRLLGAGPIASSDLPVGLRDRFVSAEGKIRIDIQPAEDLDDAAALVRFVEGVWAIAPRATGNAVNILESSRVVVTALQEALLTAVVIIALVLLLIWGNLRAPLLVMLPLALAALLTSAAAVLVGIPFNFADIIVLPLLLGIGVDSGIHLVDRARNGEAERERLLASSTARAVVFSALTTVASFGSLAFATHRGMATLGQLLTLGVAMTVVCNLVVLPALIVLDSRLKSR